MTSTNPDLKIDISVDNTGYHNSAIIPANDLLKNNGMVILTVPFTVRANREIQFIDNYKANVKLENGKLTVEFNDTSFKWSDDYIDKYRRAVYDVLEEKHMTLTPTANFGRRQTDTVVRISFKLIYPNE